MRFRLGTGLIALAATFALSGMLSFGCSSFGADAEGDDPNPNPTADGGRDSGATGNLDGSSTNDDGSTSELDAGKEGTAPIPTFCTNVTAAFCADFDHSGPVIAGFVVVTGGAGGPTAIADSKAPKSAPSCLTVNVPADLMGLQSSYVLGKQLDPAKQHVVLDVDLRINVMPGGDRYHSILGLSVSSTQYYAIVVSPANLKLFLYDPKYVNGYDFILLPKPVVGSWVHVKLDANFDKGQVMLHLDNALAATRDNAVVGSDPTAPVSLGLGIYFNAAVEGANVSYDNVIAEYAP